MPICNILACTILCHVIIKITIQILLSLYILKLTMINSCQISSLNYISNLHSFLGLFCNITVWIELSVRCQTRHQSFVMCMYFFDFHNQLSQINGLKCLIFLPSGFHVGNIFHWVKTWAVNQAQ
jgi:hypothetical protein